MSNVETPRERSGVLFIAPTLGAGGAERHWAGLVPALAQRGFAPRVVTLQGGGTFAEELMAAGVPVTVLGRGNQDARAVVQGLVLELRRRPRLVVTMGTTADLAGAVGAKLIGARHIMNWHKQAGKPLGPRRKAVVRVCAWLGSSVIAVSASQEPHLRELGFSAHRITVIDNGTVEPQPQRPPAATRALLGIPAGHQVVLGVGRLSSEKCFTRFIDAVGNLHARGIPLVGIIAGDGPDRAELQRQINRRGGGVVLLGLRRDTADLYAAADVLCMTSEFEALPMAILEAFAGRLPVVAPAIGGIPDVVVDGVNGVLVREQSASAYADALFSVIRHPNPAEMRDAARASYVSRFTHEVMVQRYAHELEETLAAIARAPCL